LTLCEAIQYPTLVRFFSCKILFLLFSAVFVSRALEVGDSNSIRFTVSDVVARR